MKAQVEILDTTLRDGEQGESIAFSIPDKLKISQLLDDLGIHIIEGGWPGANPKSDEYFNSIQKLTLKKSQIAAFGSTHHPHNKAKKDPNLNNLIQAKPDLYVIFGKTWDLHVRDALNIDLAENLAIIKNSVALLRKSGKRVIFDAEHFFDGYKAKPDYALQCLTAAVEGGADTLCLCDTNGGSLPDEIKQTVKRITEHFDVTIGIHAHNDCGLATANSLAAIEAGARHLQGTLNGYGERCGNANLSTLIPLLMLKKSYACIDELRKISSTSRQLDLIANANVPKNAPFVGQSAFAHKGGIHVSAILKNPLTYEHIDPSLVGNQQRILVSEMSGASNIFHLCEKAGIDLDKKDPRLKNILAELKAKEAAGYQYESATASLKLTLYQHLGLYKPKLKIERFRILNEQHSNENHLIEAILKIKIKGKHYHRVAEGNGPVSAIDNALRSILAEHFPSLLKSLMMDYKVRVINHQDQTESVVRVILSASDGEETWETIGVSTNIIEASFQALVDRYEYQLLKDEYHETH